MESQIKMTMEELQQEKANLEKFFTEVRVLKGAVLEAEEDRDGIAYKALKNRSGWSGLERRGTVTCQVIARYVEVDGEPYVLELVSELDENPQLYTGGADTLETFIEHYNERLYTDALTGVYNRRYYEDEIKLLTIRAGVAVIDLDDFKLYNDLYGHHAGDMALCAATQAILECVRKSDILIRYGGDEFLLILPDMSAEYFDKKLEQIHQKICSTKVRDFNRLQLAASIGGVLETDHPVEEAVERADRLMYQAKNRKNAVVTEKNKDGIISEINELEEKAEEDVCKQIVLIVDDSDFNRALLGEILRKNFSILEASSGEACLEALQQYGTGISLVLLDIVMPGMDGFGVLKEMNARHWMEDIPVIMISSEDSAQHIRRAYDLGVADYINRPFDSEVVYRRVFNTIKLYARQRRLTAIVSDQINQKEKNFQMMVSILSHIVEFRNGESGLHVQHIHILTEMLLARLVQKTDAYPLSWSEQYVITIGSALHDIGKIGIDEKILNKPDKLTAEEFEIMKSHTLIGAAMLNDLSTYKDELLLKVAYQICRWHHERYDGGGYPDGLKGEESPISAQVVALADVYDALVSKRVYKPAFSHEKAQEMIMNGECGAFNPILLECLKDISKEIRIRYENDEMK